MRAMTGGIMSAVSSSLMSQQLDTTTPNVLNKVEEEAMRWLQGEPTLEDVLSDPTVHALMKRDDADPDNFRMFLEDVRRALEGQADRQPASVPGSLPHVMHLRVFS